MKNDNKHYPSDPIDQFNRCNGKKFLGLRRFNLNMGFLHFIQGIIMILVSNDKTYPIYTNYLGFDLG
jgi:hypothetical protein